MNLVSYSSSDSDSESAMTSPKRIKLSTSFDSQCDVVASVDTELKREQKQNSGNGTLPLPDVILQLYNDRDSVPRDNPSLHGGCVRSFPHLDGNWATHVYIPFSPDERFAALMTELLQCLRPLNFTPFPEFHLSLSRTVAIRHHWINPLTSSLKAGCGQLSGCLCDLNEVALYTNDEKSRTFLTLHVPHDDTDLTEYIKMVDDCFRDFNLPTFYEPPSFHVSIAWSLGDVTGKVAPQTKCQLQKLLKDFLLCHPDLSVLQATEVQCRAGNKIFSFPLQPPG